MKTRASIVIIISILLGIAIGFMTANLIHHSRFKDIRSMSSADSFRERTFSIIQPTDNQAIELSPIIDKYGNKFDSLRKYTFTQYKDLFKDLHQEMTPYLSEDQVIAIEEFAKHYKRPHKK